jgi:hypothetical protein
LGCCLGNLLSGSVGRSRKHDMSRLRVQSRPVADASGARVLRDQGLIGGPGHGEADPGVSGTAGYLSVWSSISALEALRLTDSMPLIALALLS